MEEGQDEFLKDHKPDMEDDDFFDEAPANVKTSSSLLKNLVGTGDVESRLHSRDYSQTHNRIASHLERTNNVRYLDDDIPQNYEDIPQVSSGHSTSSDVVSPVSSKPPLPPAEGYRLANSLHISEFRDDRCKNPELRLDLSNLSLSTSKKKRRKGQKIENGTHGDSSSTDVSRRKSKSSKPKIKVPTGTVKKKGSNHKHISDGRQLYKADNDDDTCSTCQSSTSSTISEVDAEDVSERSDVTSVSPLNSPHAHHPKTVYHHATSASVIAPRNSPSSPATDDLFRLMRRLIDDADKDQRSRSKQHPAWSSTVSTDRTSSSAAWSGVSAEMKVRHPTLGEIIQSLSRYGVPRSAKSYSSTAPSISSGAPSSSATMTTLSSKGTRQGPQLDPPRRRHHAAINRDRKQREIASENLRIFQRLQGVRASPDVSRDRQIADWHRQVSYGSGANSSGNKQSSYAHASEHFAYGVAPLAGLIASAGRGTKPLRPQSAVAYLHGPSSHASSVASDVHHTRTDGSLAGSRPSSGSVHSRTLVSTANGSLHSSAYMGENDYGRRKKKKTRPISGHI